MRPTSKTVSSAASSAAIPINWRAEAPFNVGFGVVVSGTNSHKVEHTFDDIFDSTVTPTWFSHASYASAKTANFDGNYASPITAVRLTITSWTSGSSILTIVSGG